MAAKTRGRNARWGFPRLSASMRCFFLTCLFFATLTGAMVVASAETGARQGQASQCVEVASPPVEPDTLYASLDDLQAQFLSRSPACPLEPTPREEGHAPPDNSQEELFSSMCSPHSGCPQSSMIWASGSLTVADLFTPGSLLVEANLSLRLSLCCGYKFMGKMLSDEALYDTFLEELLQASPFQVLSAHEKRKMFPIEAAAIVATTQREIFRRPRPTSLAGQYEGPVVPPLDGEVLLLHTGQLPEAAMLRVISNSLALTEVIGDTEAAPGTLFRGGVDMQLRVTSRVLRCKCPHTLFVMPPLRLVADRLPPVQLLGLGPHCGVRPQQRSVAPHRHIVRVRTGPDDAVAYATTFLLQPALPPSTTVTWTVREAAGRGAVQLHHTALLPVGHNGLVASPYLIVQPHVSYTVHVRVSRGPGVVREAAGEFVLRVPFQPPWVGPEIPPQPHFGFQRRLHLRPETTRVAAAALRAAPSENWARAAFVGYWTGTAAAAGPPVRVPFSPLEKPVEAVFPLAPGPNTLHYLLSDAEEVCDPVVLETHEVWAVQGALRAPTPSPVTVCGEDVDVQAEAVREVLRAMRVGTRLAVGAPLAVEPGHFTCRLLSPGKEKGAVTKQRPPRVEQPGDETCRVTLLSPAEGDSGGVVARLRLAARGVYEVVWSAKLELRDAALMAPENLDPDFASTSTEIGPDGKRFFVTVYSKPHLIVRRVAIFPSSVSLQLPMHRRVWTVAPPAELLSLGSLYQPTAVDASAGSSAVSRDLAPEGYWSTRDPLRIISVDERQRITLDTARVPNAQQTLPNGTLQFIVQDLGEDLSQTYGIPYTSHCPDTAVEMVVEVVGVAAPDIVPDHVSLYTEESCVVLQPPREANKDEAVRWEVPPCPQARHPPFVVERVLTRAERRRFSPREHEPSCDDGDSATNDAGEQKGAGLADARETTLACGIEPYRRCDVVWAASNLVGTVRKTFSLRRYQPPPDILFHLRSVSPSAPLVSAFRIPTVRDWLDDADNDSKMESPAANTLACDGFSTSQRQRAIIPIAGYASDLAYSFNFTGLQENFEASIVSVGGEASHQLVHTQTHHPTDAEDGPSLKGDQIYGESPILWRRRAHADLAQGGPSPGTKPPTDPEVVSAAGRDGGLIAGGDPAMQSSSSLEPRNRSQVEAAKEMHRRDVAIDTFLNAHFGMRHIPQTRRLEVEGLGNSSLYPIDYSVWASRNGPNPLAAEDRLEFERRNVCVKRQGKVAILALNPRGVVLDERITSKKALEPPGFAALPSPAMAVLPFCDSQFIFSRHPDLHSVYGYDFIWECNDTNVIRVERRSATHTVLTHEVAQQQGRHGSTDAGSLSSGYLQNGTNCRLTVHNSITNTTRADWFFVRRVYPSNLGASRFAVLTDNAAFPPLGGADGGIRKLYGKSVVLHAPTSPGGDWAAVRFVPATAVTVGSRVVLDAVGFTTLPRHPTSLAEGDTVRVRGLETPGVYTIVHRFKDPLHPDLCPDLSLVEPIEVLRAKVKSTEQVVCGDTAALHAVPVPKELSKEFVGIWEVVSLQTAPGEVSTREADFSRIFFEPDRQPDTVVHGLPFGVLTVRWAIYKILPLDSGARLEGDGEGGKGPVTAATADNHRRVLVDYDTVRIIVLTESLRSRRHITLADTVDVLTSSSTVGWSVVRSGEEAAAVGVPKEMPHPLARHVALSQRPLSDADGVNTSEVGKRLRLGASMLTVSKLPVGRVRLAYVLRPSENVFGPMLGHTCKLTGTFEIERVSAFLTVNTTLQHECDAYTGKALLTLCLRAGAGASASSPPASSSTRDPLSLECLDGEACGSALRLIPLDAIEGVVKRDARLLQERHGCATPWWVWPSTRWTQVRPADPPEMPAGRCVRFNVTAGRHLSPQEVGAPLFVATPPLSAPGYSAYGGAPHVFPRASDPNGPRLCGMGDFITSAILEDAAPPAVSSSSGKTSKGDLPPRRTAASLVGTAHSNGESAARYLPILDQITLQRLPRATIRAMVAAQGLSDEVLSELNVSRGDGPVITLQLDGSQPRHFGGYFAQDSSAANPELALIGGDKKDAPAGVAGSGSRRSLLISCVEGNVRGSDVLEHWFEVDPPDGADGHAAKEWRMYVNAMKDVRVPCEVLFVSLRHLLDDQIKPKVHSDEVWEGGSTFFSSSPAQRAARQSDERSSQSTTVRDQHFVPLDVIEQQLEGIQRARRWTKDGIDVTGLGSDLQEALSHRRITKSQLQAIQKARSARLAEEAERRRRLGLPHTPTLTLQTDRFFRALRLYKNVTGEEAEVAAIRIRLPMHAPFTVPYTMHLRAALHKDVVCGTDVSAALSDPTDDPYALLPLARVRVSDEPPVVMHSPSAFKQCEVESYPPTLVVNVSGVSFTESVFPSDRVLLEEIPNPDLPPSLRAAASSSRVGLQPCLAQMRKGLQAVVSITTQKELFLQLPPCPFFEMLAQEEYDEHQDSEELLNRLQYPRFLLVVIRDALRRDSHTSTSAGVDSLSSPVRLASRLDQGGRAGNAVDLRLIIRVVPTLARLHLRYGPNAAAVEGEAAVKLSRFFTTPARPLLLCETDMRRHGFDLGVELIGDRWTDRVGRGERRTGVGEDPLGVCEDVAILNSFSVVEHHGLDSTHHLYLKGGGIYHSHFINYLVGILSDARVQQRHRFVKRFNDTFVQVEVPPSGGRGVSTALKELSWTWTNGARSLDHNPAAYSEEDDLLLFVYDWYHQRQWKQQHSSAVASQVSLSKGVAPLLRQFGKIEEILFAVPGLATECKGCVLSDTTFFVAGDLTGLWFIRTGRNGAATAAPPVVDNALLSRPLIVPWHEPSAIPRVWDFHWICANTARELLSHFDALWRTLSNDNSFTPDVSGSDATLHLEVVAYQLRNSTGDVVPIQQRPVVLLSSEPVSIHRMLGRVSAVGRASARQGDSRGAAPLDPISFRVKQSIAESAHATVAADLLRHSRRPSLSFFDYHQGGPLVQGRLALNASVVMKVCLPSTPSPFCLVVSLSDTLLVVAAPPRRATSLLRHLPFSSSRVEAKEEGGGGVHADEAAKSSSGPQRRQGRFTVMGLLHHALLSCLFFWGLPGARKSSSFAEDDSTDWADHAGPLSRLSGASPGSALHHSALDVGTLKQRRAQQEWEKRRFVCAVVFFVFLCLSYVCMPIVWVLAWLALWIFTLNWSRHPGAVLYWCLSAVYWRYI